MWFVDALWYVKMNTCKPEPPFFTKRQLPLSPVHHLHYTSAQTYLKIVPKSLGHSHVTRFPASLMYKIFPFALQSSHLCSSLCISKSKSSQPWSSAGSGRWVKYSVSVCGVQLARRKSHLSRERGQTSLHHKETWQREGVKGSHFSAISQCPHRYQQSHAVWNRLRDAWCFLSSPRT